MATYETTDVATGPTRADAESRLFRDLDPATRAWALAHHAAPGGRARGAHGADDVLGARVARDGHSLPARHQSARGAQRRAAERLKAA
jgi:hypothetical protein